MIAAIAPTMDLGGWMHDLGPFAVRISGNFGLRWYGLSYIGGFAIGWLMLRWLGRRGLTRVPPERALDAMFALVVGTMLGGRLGYILLYQPSLLWTFTDAVPFWQALNLAAGGMASHGGMVGLIVAGWWVSRGFKDDSGCRVGKCETMHVLDTLCLCGTPGVFLGRIANFINGELLGKVAANPGEPAPWWAVRFPQEVLTDHPKAQTVDQIIQIEQLSRLRLLPGETDWRIGYDRVLDAIQGGDTALAATLEPLISARHPSQLYQALAEGVLVGVVCWAIWAKPCKPGVVGAWFLISYGLVRIATEFYRLPDDHLAVQQPLGLSRGQWLSSAMVLGGAALLVWATRRKAESMGGWMTSGAKRA